LLQKPTQNPTVVEPTVAAPPIVQPVAETIAPTTVDKVESQAPASDSSFPFKESLQSLISMGFPEQECKSALTASNGNPDLAYEFLLTGIPESREVPRSEAVRVDPIQQLRQHPQLNMLKQFVQQNPAALSQVLDMIGQQNPALLAAIHENNEAFIALMNEPITETPPAQQIPQVNRNPQLTPQHHDHGDPSQMIQLLSSLPPAQRAQFAQSMGMSPEQLEGFMTMISSMPPEDLRNIFGGGGTGPEPSNVIRLTEDEMAAVNRLVELGFSQQQAAQAYLACNKNEAVAANLLLEGGWADEDVDDVNDDDMYN
jgi:UV excision repair protein RAD23